MDEIARLKNSKQKFGARWGWGRDEDGYIHDLQQDEDARREKVLKETGYGLPFLDFRNEEVMKNKSAVMGKIRGLVA